MHPCIHAHPSATHPHTYKPTAISKNRLKYESKEDEQKVEEKSKMRRNILLMDTEQTWPKLNSSDNLIFFFFLNNGEVLLQPKTLITITGRKNPRSFPQKTC